MQQQSKKDTHSKRAFATLGIIVVFAALIRVPLIGADGLWLDETFGAVLSSLPLLELIEQLRADAHPPLYFLVLKTVHLAASAEHWTEGVIRSVSLVFGLLGIGMTYLLARRFISSDAGLMAAYLLAINPMHVHYSREARAYTLLILLITSTIWAVTSLREHPSKKQAVICGVLMSLLAYTHNLAVLILIPMALWLVLPLYRLQKPSYRDALVVTAVTALVLYLPWITALLQQVTLVSNTDSSPMEGGVEWVKPIWDFMFPTQLLRSIAALSHGSPPPFQNLISVVPPEALFTAVLSLVLIFLGMFTKVHWRNGSIRNLMGYLLFAPLILMFLISWFGTPIYIPGRVDTIALPAYTILLAAGIHALNGGRHIFRIGTPHHQNTPPQRFRFPISEQLRSLICVLLLVVFTILSATPVLREIQSVEGRALQTYANKIIRRSNEKDVLIVTGIWRYGIEYYSMRANRQLHLLGYPVSRDQHPTWIRWNDYDRVRLAEDARTVARQARTISDQSGGIVWVPDYVFTGSVELFKAFSDDFMIVDFLEKTNRSYAWRVPWMPTTDIFLGFRPKHGDTVD